MMKKNILLIVAVAIALALPSCNTAEHKQADKAGTEQTANDGGFKPSGDLDKDAQTIADMIISSSQRMLNGEVNPEEDQKLADQMIKVANEYYKSQNRGEDFQAALNKATEAAIDSLGVVLGKGTR